MPTRPLATEDLDHILTHTRDLWPKIASKRIFLTGGTGFFGHWLLESFLHANTALALQAQATVLTRNAARFHTNSPHIAGNPAINLLEGDIRTFPFPSDPHQFILHAATDSGGQQTQRPAYELAESILEGTRRTLQFALATGAMRLLFTSSGAVYGRNLTGLTYIPETHPTAPDPLNLSSSYDESKRMAEHLCIAYAHNTPLQVSIARCFAFVGPHLPLDAHFAIGNFIRDAIAKTPIEIKGDGTPLRSYLYAADLAVWLWTMLFTAPPNQAFNVGSEDDHSIADLAHQTVATLSPTLPIRIHGTPTTTSPSTYVPSTKKAADLLHLHQHVSLRESIRRTARWHGFPTPEEPSPKYPEPHRLGAQATDPR